MAASIIVDQNKARLVRAAQAIASADALLIGAGAGIGVDSGLPDFRGNLGFWQAYPPFRGRTYAQIAAPELMAQDPQQAWGFYAHCMNLYRATNPHVGFQIIKRWAEQVVGDYFVFTSNVDGHFERSGFAQEKILEIHGSNHFLQCANGLACSGQVWSAEDTIVEVDEETLRATSALPKCINCGDIARPNLLMFGDRAWVPLRTTEQEDRYDAWLKQLKGANIVAIEFGAGTAIPTVRIECQKRSKTLIRVNPRDYIAPVDAISIPLNALAAIEGIEQCLIA